MQHLEHSDGELSIDVYETHARLAIHQGDSAEYNQCQSVLLYLFSLHDTLGHPEEFAAYELLWQLSVRCGYEVMRGLKRLKPEWREHALVQHAAGVVSAVNTGNYHRLCQLYNQAHTISACLMDLFMDKHRYEAVIKMCKAPVAPYSLALLEAANSGETAFTCVVACDRCSNQPFRWRMWRRSSGSSPRRCASNFSRKS